MNQNRWFNKPCGLFYPVTEGMDFTDPWNEILSLQVNGFTSPSPSGTGSDYLAAPDCTRMNGAYKLWFYWMNFSRVTIDQAYYTTQGCDPSTSFWSGSEIPEWWQEFQYDCPATMAWQGYKYEIIADLPSNPYTYERVFYLWSVCEQFAQAFKGNYGFWPIMAEFKLSMMSQKIGDGAISYGLNTSWRMIRDETTNVNSWVRQATNGYLYPEGVYPTPDSFCGDSSDVSFSITEGSPFDLCGAEEMSGVGAV